jgi:acyl-CoA dehydrogenase
MTNAVQSISCSTAIKTTTMNFELTEEFRKLQDLVAQFVNNALMPLEPALLLQDMQGCGGELSKDTIQLLNQQCRKLGLWGLDVPEQYGGANLPALAMVAVNEEVGRSAVPFHFPPDSPNLHMLMTTVTEVQRDTYLLPYSRGETVSAIGISEPGAGADPAGMTTRAVLDAEHWVLNGRKIWISKMDYADFTIVMAKTDPTKGRHGISAFLVDKDTPGFIIERKIPMIGGTYTFEILFDNCRLHKNQLLGEINKGFAPMQLRLSVRRLQMAAWCIGKARRAVEMMVEHARQRITFGQALAERQSVQWWIADAETRIHACRLMCQQAAWKLDQGLDVRSEISMAKVFGTEMAHEVIDNAMQCLGALGMTKEMPLQLMAGQVRNMRIYDGPSEVHRWVIARNRLSQ